MMNFFQKKKFNYLCSGCFDRIPQTGWLMKNGNLSPTVWRLEVPDQAWRIRCHGGLTSWLITSAFPLCLPVGEGQGALGWGRCFYKDPHPHSGGLYLRDLITAQHHHTGGYDSTREFRVRGTQSVTFINTAATVKYPKFKHILLFHYHISGNIRGQKLNLFARLNPEVKRSKRIKM